jgi:hypothetical protein
VGLEMGFKSGHDKRSGVDPGVGPQLLVCSLDSGVHGRQASVC